MPMLVLNMRRITGRFRYHVRLQARLQPVASIMMRDITVDIDMLKMVGIMRRLLDMVMESNMLLRQLLGGPL